MKKENKEAIIRMGYPFLICMPLSFLIAEIFFINIGIILKNHSHHKIGLFKE